MAWFWDYAGFEFIPSAEDLPTLLNDFVGMLG
jgi:hypothetical protein